MLHYNMRQAGMLAEPENSAFYGTEEQYQKLPQDTEFSLALYRRGSFRPTGPSWKGEWSVD